MIGRTARPAPDIGVTEGRSRDEQSSAAETRASTGSRIEHRNNFDLLRLIAAIAVLFSHSFPMVGETEPTIAGTTLGTTAVWVFFAISGYLIVGSWDHTRNVVAFLIKRALRIVPAYLVMLVIAALIIGPLETSVTLSQYFHSGTPTHFIFVNLTFPPVVDQALTGVGTPPVVGDPNMNGSIWTIPFEVRCYVLVAAIGLLGLLRNPKIAVPVFIAGIVFTGINDQPGFFDTWMFYRMFAVGGLLWTLRDHIPFRWSIMAVVCVVWFLPLSASLHPWAQTLAIPYSVVVVATRTPASLRRLTQYGDFSYGLYLWGWIVQRTLLQIFPGITGAEMFAIALPTSYALGAVSWFAVEKRFLKLKPSGRWTFGGRKRLRYILPRG
jgi:peptidoglycan/LPS O-acetylase OafA/YrhL